MLSQSLGLGLAGGKRGGAVLAKKGGSGKDSGRPKPSVGVVPHQGSGNQDERPGEALWQGREEGEGPKPRRGNSEIAGDREDTDQKAGVSRAKDPAGTSDGQAAWDQEQKRDIDKVDELMSEITEQQEIAQQISDAISRPVGFGDDVDEDELLEELEELEQETLNQELLNMGDDEEEAPAKLPDVPSTHLPPSPASEADEENELKQLVEWVS
ncbi:charged multivesicular body protein 4a isoform X2 [Dromiciops gliroides]|uniref:charged multivesicular body protein 4a isoform X2 n=1 Tax=Dromiciops gliroides TaxID=33562 RepID=UPI001CC797C8|nr:charged multivesicular body protein 4a isoform X2 [Dromiciops gliroides]